MSRRASKSPSESARANRAAADPGPSRTAISAAMMGTRSYQTPRGGPAHTRDDLAESLAEDFLQAATSGEDVAEESGDQVVPEELGGPFVETSASEEFATGTDESNPPDAETEPLPLSGPGIVGSPKEELP